MIYKGTIFKNYKFDFKKLEQFGFVLKSNCYTYKTNILDDTFTLIINIFKDGTVDTDCIECSTNEKYNLIYVKSAQGEFIGKVKEAFSAVLTKIKDECTTFTVFKSEQAHLIIKYAKEKYNSDIEYLWEKFPNNGIFRKNDNSKSSNKWFGALLTAPKSKIGLKGESEIEILNLKQKPEIIEKLIDNKKYYPAYHMNKKHWFTICLDESVDIKEIKRRIDESYDLI